MKKITSIILLLSCTLLICGCDKNETYEQHCLSFVESESISNTASETVNTDNNKDNSQNDSKEQYIISPTYDGWEDFKQNSNRSDTLLEPDKLVGVVSIESIEAYPNDDSYSFYTSDGLIHIYPLITEEEKSRLPYHHIIAGNDSENVEVITNFDIYNGLDVFEKSEYVYKYTKEGVDVYLYHVGDFKQYNLGFKIGDYAFLVGSMKYKFTDDGKLPPDEVFVKLKPEFADNTGFYDIADFSNDKSELVKALKEMVAEAENGNTVTE